MYTVTSTIKIADQSFCMTLQLYDASWHTVFSQKVQQCWRHRPDKLGLDLDTAIQVFHKTIWPMMQNNSIGCKNSAVPKVLLKYILMIQYKLLMFYCGPTFEDSKPIFLLLVHNNASQDVKMLLGQMLIKISLWAWCWKKKSNLSTRHPSW